MKEKMFKATSIHLEICECGCKGINTYLLDETGLSHAVFQLYPEDAIGYAMELTKTAVELAAQKAN